MLKQTITFLGAGSMAEAIISGMCVNKIVPREQIIATNHSNKERLMELEQKYQIHTTQNKHDAIRQSDLIVLAMKPKDIKKATDEIKEMLHQDQIIISLLAGISTSFIENALETSNSVIRVMPNTSAMIGQSATTIAGGAHTTKEQLQLVEQLMQAVGTTAIIKEEEMDAYTALAGSGPAFYYYMVEAMEQFVVEKGLDQETSKALLVQTLKGVTEMLAQSPDSPKALREKITSKGGTTEAGLKELEAYQFQQAVISCLEKATEKSNQLRKTIER